MIGIDLVNLRRIQPETSFVTTILTAAEQDVFNNLKTEKARIEYLGGRFAAKEAIFKATQDKNYLSYSILNHPDGRPYVEKHPEIEISITHDGDYAAAIVLIQSI